MPAQPVDFSEIATDPEVTKIVQALIAADKVFEDQNKFTDNYLMLRRQPAKFAEEAHQVINDFRTNPALEKIDRFARAYALRNEWKFDIQFMLELNDEFGPRSKENPEERKPLNWEHPDVHAIYWAKLGLRVAGKTRYIFRR